MVQPGWRLTKTMKKLLISFAAIALVAGCQDRSSTGGTGSSSDTTAGTGSSWSRNKSKDTNATSPRTIDTNSSSSRSTKSSN